NLMEQYTAITQAVSNIKEETSSVTSRVDVVMRSLTNPSGAGQLAEYGLENALKNLGLEKDRDFIMQHTVPGREGEGRLRPDAVVFLPNDMVMVVDCKASKFLVELAQAEADETNTEALEKKLAQTMQKHLRDLSGKDYASAVQDAFRTQGHGQKMGAMLNIMYLPSEAAWEKLHKIDPDYRTKMEKANLISASPSTLMGLFSLATLNIAEAKQMSNHHQIIEATSNLLESVSVVMGHMNSIGNGLKNAMSAFDKAAKSANSRLLPRMLSLGKQGVKPARNKEIPSPIATYDVRKQDDMLLIEAEAEYAEDYKRLESTDD
ncbi:MAG: DNA recombination protein RmuC, partial [Rickettsiales bacterium]